METFFEDAENGRSRGVVPLADVPGVPNALLAAESAGSTVCELKLLPGAKRHLPDADLQRPWLDAEGLHLFCSQGFQRVLRDLCRKPQLQSLDLPCWRSR